MLNTYAEKVLPSESGVEAKTTYIQQPYGRVKAALQERALPASDSAALFEPKTNITISISAAGNLVGSFRVC
jgi:hypothetical protein